MAQRICSGQTSAADGIPQRTGQRADCRWRHGLESTEGVRGLLAHGRRRISEGENRDWQHGRGISSDLHQGAERRLPNGAVVIADHASQRTDRSRIVRSDVSQRRHGRSSNVR
jgi:hypothetical protein